MHEYSRAFRKGMRQGLGLPSAFDSLFNSQSNYVSGRGQSELEYQLRREQHKRDLQIHAEQMNRLHGKFREEHFIPKPKPKTEEEIIREKVDKELLEELNDGDFIR